MNRKFVRLAALLAALAFLSACSMLAPSSPDRLALGLTPTNELGYEVDSSGEITITNRNMLLSTKAGMPVTNVTGYRVDYFDAADRLIGASSANHQSLNVTVPAGFSCDEPAPVIGCTLLSAGATPAPGMAVEVEGISSQFLSGDIAQAHALAGTPVGWYAVVTLYYDNARGSFEEEYTLYIVVPN